MGKEQKKDSKKLVIIILIILIVLLCSYIVFDYLRFNHIEKGIVNNIYDVKVKGNDNFVFVGDSITAGYELDEYYEGLPLVNSGIGGNITDDILGNMKERVYQYNPTKVFLLIGTNDIDKGRTSKEVYDNIVEIISEIEENRPETEIYVESIYPINNTEDEKINPLAVRERTNEQIQEINEMVKNKYENDPKVTYIDVYTSLKDQDGNLKLSYTVEGLHLTPLGYVTVTRVLLPYMQNNK